ncbi:hypothetical protein FKN04_12835 [Bacillus glycinifermentans]|uniref:hypothetical protein n=1 Tax=Bacillus TaxID=1386 RepID=UPI0015830F08|nr:MULTISPECIES: hypothetical protein [Bacillus]NUJ17461.1 hypothetical protein [Bacillus glycinifermentans]GIN67038.1 hypothetical protein J41TS2_24590 [Bacillus sonorensis]
MYATALDSVEQFIHSLSLPFVIAKGILRSDEDCHLFYNKFYMKNRNTVDDLLDFKEYKISKSNIELNEFLKICQEEGIHEIFEQTFFQVFSPPEIKLINSALSSGKVTLTQIYNSFKENPHKNVMKNIL